jgi:hypothetical protein
MLVDHLADGVLQENDKLVEGLDLSLQLDAVDEVDGNGYALPTQGVQEGLL